jgi:hypothetical protein
VTAREKSSMRRLLEQIAGELEAAEAGAKAKAQAEAPAASAAFEAGLLGAACRGGAYGIRAVITAYLVDTKVRA